MANESSNFALDPVVSQAGERQTDVARQPYNKPQLQFFGRVQDLTQAGSTGSNEQGAPPSCDAMANTRSPNC